MAYCPSGAAHGKPTVPASAFRGIRDRPGGIRAAPGRAALRGRAAGAGAAGLSGAQRRAAGDQGRPDRACLGRPHRLRFHPGQPGQVGAPRNRRRRRAAAPDQDRAQPRGALRRRGPGRSPAGRRAGRGAGRGTAQDRTRRRAGRDAVDRRAAVRQCRRRSRAQLPGRRPLRGHHHRPVALPAAAGDRAQFLLPAPRRRHRPARRRADPRRRLCGDRQRAPARNAPAPLRPADGGGQPQRIMGRALRPQHRGRVRRHRRAGAHHRRHARRPGARRARQAQAAGQLRGLRLRAARPCGADQDRRPRRRGRGAAPVRTGARLRSALSARSCRARHRSAARLVPRQRRCGDRPGAQPRAAGGRVRQRRQRMPGDAGLGPAAPARLRSERAALSARGRAQPQLARRAGGDGRRLFVFRPAGGGHRLVRADQEGRSVLRSQLVLEPARRDLFQRAALRGCARRLRAQRHAADVGAGSWRGGAGAGWAHRGGARAGGQASRRMRRISPRPT